MEKDNQFFTTYEETEAWLQSMSIKNYTINDDLTIDVNDSVNLDEKNLNYIPVQFGKVGGIFRISDNNLTTLKGCPNVVGGSFVCSSNKLESIKGNIKEVGISFHCINNKITTLEGFLAKIGGVFYCYDNLITDFNYLNFEVAGDIYFTPTKDIDYLDSYKDNQGDIKIPFNDFKRIQTLKNLENKLNNDLSIKSVKIKHKI